MLTAAMDSELALGARNTSDKEQLEPLARRGVESGDVMRLDTPPGAASYFQLA